MLNRALRSLPAARPSCSRASACGIDDGRREGQRDRVALYSARRFEVPSDKIASTMKLAIVSIRKNKRFKADHSGGVDRAP